MENPTEPIIVTDTEDLRQAFAAYIHDNTLGTTVRYAERISLGLIEILRASGATAEVEGEPCRLPYTYFVSYAHRGGFGNNEIGCSIPVERYEDVQLFRHTIVSRNNPYCLRAEDIVILNFILLSGPKEA